MPARDDRPYVDVLSLTDEDLYLYETVATLENIGHPVTRREVAAVTDMDDDRVDERLAVLARRRLLVRHETAGEPAFEPARRDWSAAPERPR